MDRTSSDFLLFLAFVLYLFRYGIRDWFHAMTRAFREGRSERRP